MKNSFFVHRSAYVLVVAFVFTLAACASSPVPTGKLAVAEASVLRANTRSISESAPGELQIAIAKLASAKQALASKEYELAGQLAEQATLDAEVAERQAESVRSQIAAKESQEAARVLRDEINRNVVR